MLGNLIDKSFPLSLLFEANFNLLTLLILSMPEITGNGDRPKSTPGFHFYRRNLSRWQLYNFNDDGDNLP
jgi:hypothetical protein